MSFPSFEELYERAQAIGRAKSEAEDFPTGAVIAKSVSDFVTRILTEGGKGEEFGGTLGPKGFTPFEGGSRFRGGSLLSQMLGPKGRSLLPQDIPGESIPVPLEQSLKFEMEKALEQQKIQGRLDVEKAKFDRIQTLKPTKWEGSPTHLRQQASDNARQRMALWMKTFEGQYSSATEEQIQFDLFFEDELIKLGVRPSAVPSKRKSLLPSKVMKNFKSDAEALDAVKRGEIKVGDKILINGEEVTLTP